MEIKHVEIIKIPHHCTAVGVGSGLWAQWRGAALGVLSLGPFEPLGP